MQVEDEQVVKTPEEDTEAKDPKSKEKKPINVKKEILSWVLTLGAAVVIALLIRTFLFEPIRVDGESMCDTLQNKEIM
ncbi:MAG: S26 family signal peptidase, partial [Clostridia bacterium]